MAESAKRRVGAYAKLLANYASDDAIMAAGEAAELLFVRGLAFCATSDSDGYITDAQVVRYVGAGMRDAQKRATRLVDVGVWERVAGGYLVRSWLKLHESTEEKGRKLKADRERKRRLKESAAASERNPDGIPTEGVAESLSMTRQDTAGHDNDTTPQEQGSSEEGGDRYVPLRAVPETSPSLDDEPDPSEARCTDHKGVENPPKCHGCKKARLADEKLIALARAEEARLAASCSTCEGTRRVLDENKLPTGRRCNHLEETA